MFSEKIQTLQKQIDDITTKLGDARVDKHEDFRRRKKQEIVETFKTHFPGVVSSVKLCYIIRIFFWV